MTDAQKDQHALMLVDTASATLVEIGLKCSLNQTDMFLVLMTMVGIFLESSVKPEHHEFMLEQLVKDVKEGIEEGKKAKDASNG